MSVKVEGSSEKLYLECSVSNNHMSIITYLNIQLFPWLQKQEVCYGGLFFFYTIKHIVCLLYQYLANIKPWGKLKLEPWTANFQNICLM